MSASPGFLPWQRETATAWLSHRDRFSHAWLIHGMAGIGKQQFALAAAASLLCETPVQGLACHRCQACQWFAGGNHPDVRRLRPDAVALEEIEAGSVPDSGPAAAQKAPSKEIRIDQLRELGSWFNTATHRGGWRVAVLYPAHALNLVSANALLKVLEEPPAHTVFLLVADAPDRLLPTLVSRCRRLPLPIPSFDAGCAWLTQQGVKDASAWLAAASNAPLRARRLALSGGEPCPSWLAALLGSALDEAGNPDIGSFADELEKQAPAEWIDALQRLVTDLALARAGLDVRYYPGLRSLTEQQAAHASMRRLLDTAKWLAEQRGQAGHPLNARLLAHTVLQRVARACQPYAPGMGRS